MGQVRAFTRLIALGLGVAVAATGWPSLSTHPARAGTAPDLSAFGMPADAQLTALTALEINDEPLAVAEKVDIGDAEVVGFAAADALPEVEWDIEELADSLDYDPQRAHAFVRDSISFEPYAGILRGAEGTLKSRAGNSWDRALLLSALLDEMLVEHRFAIADLDDAQAAELVGRAFEPPVSPLTAIDPSSVITLDMDAVASRAQRDYALLRNALGDRIEDMGADPAPWTLDAVRRHVWVQAARGAEWLDLDPSLADGTPLATAAETTSALPDDARHSVTVSLIVESLLGNSLTASTLLERHFDAASDSPREIYLYFQPEIGGIGGGIVSVLTGDEPWVPVLLVDGEGELGTPFSAVGRGTDILGDPTEAPQLTRMRLVVTREGPGHEPEQATNTLLDRLPAGLDPSGEITPGQLLPMPQAEGVPFALGMIHHLMLSNGAGDLRDHAIALGAAANFVAGSLTDADAASGYALQDLLWPVAVGDQSVVLASEELIVPGLSGSPDVRAVIDRPRVYLATIGPEPQVEGAVSAAIDLTLDGVSMVGRQALSGADVARHQLWYGALQTALETEFMLKRARAIDPVTRRLVAVSLGMDRLLEVLDPDDASTLDPDAGAALRTALNAGRVAIVPGGASGASGFWSIAPGTGATESILETGPRGGFTGGGNYVDGTTGGPRYVVGPGGEDLGYIKDGKFYPNRRPPPRSCRSGGNEYITILGCVSIPASWALGVFVGATVVAIVSWAIVLMMLV